MEILNIGKSANERAREAAAKKQFEAQRNAQIRQERLQIRLQLLMITEDAVKASTAWKVIKDIKFPDITVYANALYVAIKNGEMPTLEQLDVIVDYLREDA